jgi:hypothetical protein
VANLHHLTGRGHSVVSPPYIQVPASLRIVVAQVIEWLERNDPGGKSTTARREEKRGNSTQAVCCRGSRQTIGQAMIWRKAQ